MYFSTASATTKESVITLMEGRPGREAAHQRGDRSSGTDFAG